MSKNVTVSEHRIPRLVAVPEAAGILGQSMRWRTYETALNRCKAYEAAFLQYFGEFLEL